MLCWCPLAPGTLLLLLGNYNVGNLSFFIELICGHLGFHRFKESGFFQFFLEHSLEISQKVYNKEKNPKQYLNLGHGL